jgi:hypothetical protein
MRYVCLGFSAKYLKLDEYLGLFEHPFLQHFNLFFFNKNKKIQSITACSFLVFVH